MRLEQWMGVQSLVNLWDSAVLRLTLRSIPPSPLKDDGEAQPMAWVPLLIPTNAAAMAFDFTVTGNPQDDVLVCGIGTNNLFSVEAKYIPTNVASASRLMDVTAWASATNELFFGLIGGTSTNCTVQVENIRFYSLTQPRLEISMTGGFTSLTWPSTAGGYVVEATPTLSSPAWEIVSNVPVISGDHYVLTNNWAAQSRFFRLRAR